MLGTTQMERSFSLGQKQPGDPGGHQVEHDWAVCPNSKGCPAASLFKEDCYQQVMEGDKLWWDASGVLHPVLGSLI